ncbi:MAG: hypothetical protein IKD88_07830 [Lachnospiraceae bacterium]|nr:hypothetical protein [Lachnospiraceae bacterium]MBR6356650.1 hypothetical protein [Lachnospiraceae bacterium]
MKSRNNRKNPRTSVRKTTELAEENLLEAEDIDYPSKGDCTVPNILDVEKGKIKGMSAFVAIIVWMALPLVFLFVPYIFMLNHHQVFMVVAIIYYVLMGAWAGSVNAEVK